MQRELSKEVGKQWDKTYSLAKAYNVNHDEHKRAYIEIFMQRVLPANIERGRKYATALAEQIKDKITRQNALLLVNAE